LGLSWTSAVSHAAPIAAIVRSACRNDPVPTACQHRLVGITRQPEAIMSDLDDFLATTLARQIKAEEAIHNGDAEPRLAMWSRQDPVTVLGASRSATGWEQVNELFHWLAAHFSDCTSYRFDLVAAGVSGELAYTVGYEHTSTSWDGVPMEPYTLRVTLVYRREDGEWKIVHRHADGLSVDLGAAG
jgi:ketosteroid isomerase-like protein